jgi:rhodanese-related sulfurtransferase
MRFANKERVKQLLATNKAMLVDMRSPVHFRDTPVKGAVNLPLRNLTNELVKIKDKSKPVILFGVGSNDSDVKAGITYSENLGFDTYVTDIRQLQEDSK